MKNLWLIAVVVFSFFACNEKKEQELTPIYADAFYEPDFIPYLMLKHGVDTIKEIVIYRRDSSHWLMTQEVNELNCIWVRNKRINSVGVFPQYLMPQIDFFTFNEDSLVFESTYGSCSRESRVFSYNRKGDTIYRFASEIFGFSTENDSIYYLNDDYFKTNPRRIDTSFLILENNQIVSLLNGSINRFWRLKKDFIYHNNQMIKSKEKLIPFHNLTGLYDSIVKEFKYTQGVFNKVLKYCYLTPIEYEDEIHITTFRNNLPHRKVIYNWEKSDSVVLNYQIIRNAK